MNDVQSPPAAEKSAGPSEDLSARIIQTIAKVPGDQVTCRRVNHEHYRCNWWHRQSTDGYDNPAMPGLLVTTFRVRKSQFLRVRVTANGLQIESVGRSGD